MLYWRVISIFFIEGLRPVWYLRWFSVHIVYGQFFFFFFFSYVGIGFMELFHKGRISSNKTLPFMIYLYMVMAILY